MARFRFSLAPLLRLRAHAEDQRKRELGEALRVKEAADQALRDLQADRDRLIAECAPGQAAFDTERRRQLNLYLGLMADRIRAAGEYCRQAENGILQAKEALKTAIQQRKILERLREIRQEEFRGEENRRQQKALDEHAAHFLRREKEIQTQAQSDE